MKRHPAGLSVHQIDETDDTMTCCGELIADLDTGDIALHYMADHWLRHRRQDPNVVYDEPCSICRNYALTFVSSGPPSVVRLEIRRHTRWWRKLMNMFNRRDNG